MAGEFGKYLKPVCLHWKRSSVLSVTNYETWKARNKNGRSQGRNASHNLGQNMGRCKSPNNLEKRILQKWRTYNTGNQQTQFYWVCSWELMESAKILMPPSTGLRGILLSVRIQNSRMTRIWKNINIILMHGEKFYQLWRWHGDFYKWQ